MDAVGAFMASLGEPGFDTFVVSGESKRGWTTWTTAAVDPRVVAMIPIVMDEARACVGGGACVFVYVCVYVCVCMCVHACVCACACGLVCVSFSSRVNQFVA